MVHRVVGKEFVVRELMERCGRCGSVVYGFSKKRAASDGNIYCVKCAETADRHYLIKNTCSVCSVLLSKDDLKIVMPSKLYSAEPLPLGKRLVCANCYKRFARRSRMKRIVNMKYLRENIKRNFISTTVRQR